MTTVLGFALAVAIGWVVVRACAADAPLPLLLRAVCAAGVGCGATSLAFLGWLQLERVPAPSPWPLDFALAAALAIVALVVRVALRRASTPAPALPERARTAAWQLELLLALALVALVAGCAFGFALLSRLEPLHGSDSQVIWNFKARFLFRGGAHWLDFLHPALAASHPDYPLLLPASVARIWAYAGEETEVASLGWAAFFTFGTVGALGAAIAALRGRAAGCLAAMAVLVGPQHISVGASQMADAPVAFFLVAATAVLVCGARTAAGRPGVAGPGVAGPGAAAAGPGHLVLAGALLGCAAWTKNEALPCAGALVLARILIARRSGWRAALRAQVPLQLGMAPALLALAWFKLRLAPTNDLVEGVLSAATLERIVAWERYATILSAFADCALTPRPIGMLFLLGYLLLLGRARDPRDRDAARMLGLALAVVLAGIFALYVVTPRGLAWHLSTSLGRIVQQIWPCAVLLVFLVARDPAAAWPRS
jgi:hypothetical protein